MQKTVSFFMLVVLIGLTGCASPKMNMPIPVDKVIQPIRAKAIVYFVRPRKDGYAVHSLIFDGDKFVGFVPYGKKLPYLAVPGEHIFMIISESADFMKQNYFPERHIMSRL